MFEFAAGYWHVHRMGKATLVATMQLAYCCFELQLTCVGSWTSGASLSVSCF